MYRNIICRNIFISKDKKLKIGDFGISKISKDSTRTFHCTVLYASPQILDREPFNKKSDVW